MMAGLMWNWSFPINKSIWTSSYVVFCAGMACVALATIMWIVDVQQREGLDEVLRHLRHEPDGGVRRVGRDGALHLLDLQGQLRRQAVIPLRRRSTSALFASWLEPVNASLAFAITFVLFWFAVLYVLYRKQIFFKV